MPLVLNGRTIFTIGEALEQAGISRATYFRWIKQGRIRDAEYRDRNGRRVMTPEEVEALRSYSQRMVASSPQLNMEFGKTTEPVV
jgi:predicted site-specific integrase-resolvase